jgi:isorenieratene synthase
MIGLTRSGLSGQPDEIPLSGFLAFLRFYTVMRRDTWAFSYMPRDAGTCLIDPMVGRLEALGGKLTLGAKVSCLNQTAEGWRVTWQGNPASQSGGEIMARQVILATDTPNTEKILRGSPSTAEFASRLELPHAAETVIARLWFNRMPDHTSEAGIFSGEFTLDNFFWLDQIQEPYIRWRKATGGSAIEAHIYGPPQTLAEPDGVLLAKAISDVQSAFPELRGHRIYNLLQRNPATHTLFGVGPADRHLGIETPWKNLYCCGDWVRHPNPALFLERACVTGIAAANIVLESQGLSSWPLLEYPQPEPLVGWIERLIRSGRRARKLRSREKA